MANSSDCAEERHIAQRRDLVSRAETPSLIQPTCSPDAIVCGQQQHASLRLNHHAGISSSVASAGIIPSPPIPLSLSYSRPKWQCAIPPAAAGCRITGIWHMHVSPTPSFPHVFRFLLNPRERKNRRRNHVSRTTRQGVKSNQIKIKSSHSEPLFYLPGMKKETMGRSSSPSRTS